MYKLIAIDMDGTLLKGDHSISDRNISAIRAAKKLGVKIALTTGRPPIGVKQYVEMLGLNHEDDYCIGYNGGLIENIKTGDVISYMGLTGKEYKELYKIGIALGFEPYTFDVDKCVATEIYPCVHEEVTINRMGLELVDIETFPDDRIVSKVMFTGTKEVLDQNIPRIPKELYERYSVMRSSPQLFELLNQDVDKGAGVGIYAKHLGIKQEEVMCIGDSGNDVHMIAYAGFGVAMGNGIDEVKKIADFVTLTNEEDGVAHAIEQFVL